MSEKRIEDKKSKRGMRVLKVDAPIFHLFLQLKPHSSLLFRI